MLPGFREGGGETSGKNLSSLAEGKYAADSKTPDKWKKRKDLSQDKASLTDQRGKNCVASKLQSQENWCYYGERTGKRPHVKMKDGKVTSGRGLPRGFATQEAIKERLGLPSRAR